MIVLFAMRGPDRGRVFLLPSGREVTIGGTGADIALHDPAVEHLHLRIFRAGGRWWVEPTERATDTHVNGEPIDCVTALHRNDRLGVGQTLMLVAIDKHTKHPLKRLPIELPAGDGARPEPGQRPHPVVRRSGLSRVRTLPVTAEPPAVRAESRWRFERVMIVAMVALLAGCLIAGTLLYAGQQRRIDRLAAAIESHPDNTKLLSGIRDELSTLSDNQPRLRQSLSGIRQELASREAALRSTAEGLDEAVREYRTGADELAEGTEALDARIERMQARLERREQTQQQVDRKLEKVIERLAAMAEPFRASGRAFPVSPAGAEPRVSSAWQPIKESRNESASEDAIDGEGRRLVYVIDASKCPDERIGVVPGRLMKRIEGLDPKDRFTVVLAQGSSMVEAPPRGLKPATASARGDVRRWLNSRTADRILRRSQSRPVDAFVRALAYRPQRIVLFAGDGLGSSRDRPGAASLSDALKRLNAEGQVRIDVVQMFYRDPHRTLQSIAEDYGGRYRLLVERHVIRPGRGVGSKISSETVLLKPSSAIDR